MPLLLAERLDRGQQCNIAKPIVQYIAICTIAPVLQYREIFRYIMTVTVVQSLARLFKTISVENNLYESQIKNVLCNEFQ